MESITTLLLAETAPTRGIQGAVAEGGIDGGGRWRGHAGEDVDECSFGGLSLEEVSKFLWGINTPIWWRSGQYKYPPYSQE